jgi:rhodanese-related sulfurtransferase
MNDLIPIDAVVLAPLLKQKKLTLVDIREPDEFARERVEGAISLPLSRLEAGRVNFETHGEIVFNCKTGMRTNANCARLSAHAGGPAYVLSGGLDAWKKAGLAVTSDAKAPIEIMRQVQITAGSLVLAGALLAVFVDPLFVWLSAIIGGGLLFSGASGWCGMAMLLSLAPWNRKAV